MSVTGEVSGEVFSDFTSGPYTGKMNPSTVILNGVLRNSRSFFTRESIVWAISDGQYVQIPANVPVIPGGRLATTVADGARLGPELVTNGDFNDGAAGWSALPAGFSVLGNALHVDGSQSDYAETKQVAKATVDTPYYFSYEVVTGVATPQLTYIYFGRSGIGSLNNSVPAGIYDGTVVATHTDGIGVQARALSAGLSIDNISVREVIPTWLPTGNETGPLLHSAYTNKCECYSVPVEGELGNELAPLDFQSDPWVERGAVTIIDSDSFESVGGAVGMQASVIVAGRKYRLVVQFSSTASVEIKSSISGAGVDVITTTSGQFDFIAASIDLYIRHGSGGRSDFTKFELYEIPLAIGTTATTASPTAIPGMTISGDAAATLTIVSETEANLQAAKDRYGNDLDLTGLYEGAAYAVYELDNSVGSVTALALFDDVTGNINEHSSRCYAIGLAGSPAMLLSGGEGSVNVPPDIYSEVVSESITPGASTRKLALRCFAGAKVRFIAPQLIEKTYMPKGIILTEGATKTVDATLLTMPTAGTLPANDFSIEMVVVPSVGGQASKYILSSFLDTDNDFKIGANAGAAFAMKEIGGVLHTALVGYTHQADIPFALRVICSSITGLSISIDGGTPDTNTNTADNLHANDFKVGSRGEGQRFEAEYKYLKIHRTAKPTSWLTEAI